MCEEGEEENNEIGAKMPLFVVNESRQGGIRTHGTARVRRFSRPVLSTTQPPV